jgi:hypothetical protein
MAGYSEDLDMSESHEQDPNMAQSRHRSFGEPPTQESNDLPYGPRQADDDGFPSQQGYARMRYGALSPYSFQTQGMECLPEPNGFAGGVGTDALYENNSPPSSGTRPFQQMGSYLMSYPRYSPYSRFRQVNYPQTMGSNLAEGDSDENWYQGARSPTTDNMAQSYQPVLLRDRISWQGVSGGTDIGAYHPRYNTEPGPPPGSTLFTSNNTTPYQAPQATNDEQDWMETTRAPVNLAPNGFDHLSPESNQIHIDSAHAEPWSPFQSADANQAPQYHGGDQMTGQHETSDTTQSMFSGGPAHSNYIVNGGAMTPLSSMDIFNDHVKVSMMTERALHRMIPNDQPFNLFQGLVNLERSATPQIGDRPSLERYPQSEQGPHLAPPMERKASSAYSYSTDGSSPGPPPADDPVVLYCNKAGCSSFFTGIHRRGNLGRHRRQQHKSGKAYVCEDDACAREFKRSDARVKHYRKYHPGFASKYVPRPQTRRLRGDQDDVLRNISSWT